jgi:hypothetical protein
MFTRREFVIAVCSIALTLTVVVGAKQVEPKIMGSSVFEWNNFEAKPSKVGFVRQGFSISDCHVGRTRMPHHDAESGRVTARTASASR